MTGIHQALLSTSQSTGDPYFSSVGFLLHFNGADGSQQFPDSGPYNKTFTLFGGGGTAQISTTESVFGGSSYRQTGFSGYRITTGSDATYITASGSTAWTWEARVRLDNFTVAKVLFDNDDNASNTTGWQIYVGTDARFYVYSGPQATSYGGHGAAMSASTWYALAITWDGTTLRFFRDGSLLGSNTGFTNVWGSTVHLWNSTFLNQAAAGYFDETRWTKGVARYVATYTIETGQW